jgi:hypothetical protein
MNKLNFSPDKYWNVGDERLTILKKYLSSLNINDEDLLPEDEIIKICIEGLKNFDLTDEEKSKLKNLILRQNSLILTPSIKEICNELSLLSLNEVTLISLGIGNESLFERTLDEELRKKLPNLKVNWLGVDVGDFRDKNSFFHDKPFKIIEEDSSREYIALLNSDHTPAILIGRYSFHHIGIEYTEFLKRCKGMIKVLLVEEPTTSELWNLPDYRVMRIAYDVLANTVFVVNWAKAFMDNPALFKINYIKMDKLPKDTNVLEFKNVLPETALVSTSCI